MSSLTDDNKKEVNENFSVCRKNLIDVFSQNPIQSIILRRGEQALDCLKTREEVQRKIAKAKEEKIEKAAAAAVAAAQKSKKNADSMDVPESSTPRAAPVSELPPINLGHKKGGDVSTERKRKFSSASSSSVSAEFSTCRFPPIGKNTREIKSSSASSSSVAAESPTCRFPSIGKNTREHSAVREENPYEKMFAPRNGSKHTGRG